MYVQRQPDRALAERSEQAERGDSAVSVAASTNRAQHERESIHPRDRTSH